MNLKSIKRGGTHMYDYTCIPNKLGSEAWLGAGRFWIRWEPDGFGLDGSVQIMGSGGYEDTCVIYSENYGCGLKVVSCN
jgi:hypothetical protein